MPHLELASISKSFKSNKVLDDISLAADAGEIVVIFGPSGTGKTVLLRLIAGVEEPTAGTISIDDQDMADVAPEHRDVGMAFQNFALFPHFDAFENIATPLRARAQSAAQIKEGVARVAKLLKIDHVLSHAPRQLSNGQKQRTALARALASSPKLLLLDDPLRNVDAKLRFEMRLELPRLLREAKSTVLYVTQDYKEAMALADRIAVLAHGKFVQVATPEEIYRHPATVNVARLFGDPTINLVETVVGEGATIDLAGETVEIDKAYAGLKGRSVTFGVRPEAVALGDGAGLKAQVMAVTPLNERTVLLLQTKGGAELLASLPSSSPAIPKAESEVTISFNPIGSHLFDRETGATHAKGRA
ncbi:ABC transporter ATP-binding protein [Aestuariivirga sp. YIM B02566]|uniref:ABC transporter ATP-binding protein n=1 Tax=Taklimakanibacter albus TaxID=2800327 RepID=A0ACC5R7Y2_9HYPH|nr:ABC transporter ATP-binding protein [Aestuariivirga sp. YIM B02566]MBK1868738.1 ABC transporter ATP-binding protein [Aestuariivirga sp. YIM B02566]